MAGNMKGMKTAIHEPGRLSKLFRILNNVTDIAIQDIAKSGKNIGVNTLNCSGTPFFNNLKTGISQFCQTVPGNAIGFHQFLQVN